MAFSEAERAALLAAPFVGATVLRRFEEVGFGSIEALAGAEAESLCRLVAAHMGNSCWANAPQARRAVANAIDVARQLRAPRP